MWLALSVAAHAGGLVLPPGEDPSAWAPALALAGLDGTGDRVVLSHDRAGWWLAPPDGPRVPVPAPHDAAGREAIAVLAASLLRRVGTDVALPDLPPILPPPAPRARRPVPAPAPTPAPTEIAPPPAPAVAADDLPEPLVPEVLDGLITLVDPDAPAPTARWSPWADAGVGAAWREGVRAGPTLQVGGGAALGPGRIGVRAGWVDRLEIPLVGDDRGFSAVELLGGGWLAPLDSATLGVVGGASFRRGTEGGTTVFRQTRGIVGGELGGRIAAGRVELLPRLRILGDLAETALVADGQAVGTLSPVQIAAELAVAPRFRP